MNVTRTQSQTYRVQTPRLTSPRHLASFGQPMGNLRSTRAGVDPSAGAALRHQELSRDFWNHMRGLPRGQVLDVVSSLAAQQTAQGGVTSHNRVFLKSFRDHLDAHELQQLQQRLQRDSGLKSRSGSVERQRILQDLRLLWGQATLPAGTPNAPQAPAAPSTNPTLHPLAPQTPAADPHDDGSRFFFQQSLLGLTPSGALS